MSWKSIALILAAVASVGVAVDCLFISQELKGKLARATALKGFASMFFVAFGIVAFSAIEKKFGIYSWTGYIDHARSLGVLILIGLCLGMLGDILLNLRNQLKGKASMGVFALGILAFLSGHFLYIAALIKQYGHFVGQATAKDLLIAIAACAVLSAVSIPPLMKRISAPNKGLKIFGYVYLIVVIAMLSFAATNVFMVGFEAKNIVFAVGAFLFTVSDFIMIYYSFGKKKPPLRVANLLLYYFGQLLIALCILV